MAKQQQHEKRNYPHVERYPLKNFNFLSCHHEGGGTLLGGRVRVGGGGISRRGVQKVSPHPLRSNCIHCFCSLVNKFTIDYYFILLCHFADKDRLFAFWIRRGELIDKKIVIFGIGFEENTLPCLLLGFPFHINAANGKKRELEL